MKHRRSGGTAPLIHNLSTRWRTAVRFMSRPFHSRGKNPRHPLSRSLFGSQSCSERFDKSLFAHLTFVALGSRQSLEGDTTNISRHKWVPVTTAWRVLRLRMEERPPVWRVAANILNKQSRTADKGWSPSLGIGRGASNSSP